MIPRLPRRIARGWVRQAAPPLLVIAACATVGHVLEGAVAERERGLERTGVLEKLATVRARLEGALVGNLLLIQGLTGPLALEPDMDRVRFEALSRELLAQPNQLRNVAAARDLVITHMYPLEGNEAALGLDYRRVPTQREAALRARDTRGLVVAGPVDLVQGGRGLIGRAPVFLTPAGGAPGAGPFWGLVSAVIDLEALLAHAGVLDRESGLTVALRGVDGTGPAGDVFHGDPALFTSGAVTLDVALPGGSWQIAALPSAGWTVSPAAVWPVRGVTVLVAIVLAHLVWLGGRQRQERARARRYLDRSRRRMADAIESLGDGFALWDGERRLLLSNRRFGRMLAGPQGAPPPGTDHAQILRTALDTGCVVPEGDRERWLERFMRPDDTTGAPLELNLAGGRIAQLTRRPTSEGGTVEIYTDITQMRRAEAAIRRRANVDPLTGLSNRARFLEQLESTVRLARRSGRQAALLFVDLDRFKNVNDSLGHGTGDRLLEEAARRIVGCVRSTDTVARLGGDEFTVLLHDAGEGLGPAKVAEKITRRLSRRFDLDGHEVYAGASIGITVCPEDGDDPGTLLKNADMAMYRAKEAGRNTYRFFTPEMTVHAQRFVALEGDLRRAFSQGEQLALAYQPIVDLESGAVEGVEALLRWTHPQLGPVSPAEFIPVAEESGLIVQLGAWVLERACQEVMAAVPRGTVPPRLSINVSGRQLRAGFGAGQVCPVLERTGLPPSRLVVEITESTLLDDDARVRESLQELRALGVGLAVDDFGTGYSSLGYLRRLPVSEIKIDRSFVRDMETDAADARLVESILAMARALELTAVAEGVETAGQLDALTRLGCPLAQGFHLGRPQPIGELWPRVGAPARAVVKGVA